MEKIRFDYSKLRGRIVEKYGTQQAFALDMGISDVTMSCKLNGHTYFKQNEIAKAAKLLDVSAEEVSSYFLLTELGKVNRKENLNGEK